MMLLKIVPIILFLKIIALQTRNRLKANSMWLNWQGFGYKRKASHVERIEAMA